MITLVVGLFCFIVGLTIGLTVMSTSHENLEQLELAQWREPTLEQYELSVNLTEELMEHLPKAVVRRWRYDEDLRIHQATVRRLKEERDGLG